MKPWVRFAVGLYPADWRNRYGAEFGALLEDVGPGWRDFWDVLRGALAMQMKLMWNFRNVTAACGLAGLIIAAIVAFRMDDRYVSDAVLRLTAPAGAKVDDGVMAKQLQQMIETSLSRTFLTGIIQRPELDLYERERRSTPLEDVVKAMMKDIQIRIRPARADLSNVFQIQFQYPDPVRAQSVTRILAARMIEMNVRKGSAPDSSPATLRVLDPANLPQKPAFPNRPVILALGLIGGLALGATLMGVRRWRLS